MKSRRECPLPESALELVASRFALLSEPMRLRILMKLMSEEANVGEIAASLEARHSNVSRHLQHLCASGAVGRRKQGFEVYYRLTDPTLPRLCELMCSSLEKRLAMQVQGFGPKLEPPDSNS